jgi:hypothetical protein
MKNDILVCLAFSFSLATENWKRKRTGKTNWAMALVCFSHFYSKWQGATSVDSCSVLFSFSRFFSLFSFFFVVFLKLIRLIKYVDAFSRTLSRKKKRNRAEKQEKKECRHRRFSVISNFSCQFSLYATKEKKKKKKREKKKNDAGKRWIDG